MKLLFNREQVQSEVSRVEAAGHYPATLYDDNVGPGLLLVGDQGVYLMGNDPGRDPKKHKPVYAKGIDPNVDAFDDWWAEKRATFGGDDGVEHLSLSQVKEWLEFPGSPKWLVIEISPVSLTLVSA